MQDRAAHCELAWGAFRLPGLAAPDTDLEVYALLRRAKGRLEALHGAPA